MRIRDLRIDGFGRFANLQLGPFNRPVTVFHGPNEAGKSTLLEFIRRVLFGFPDGRSRLNPYPPLAGGRHGGRVTILSDAGEVVTIHRSQGARGGVVTLSTELGRPLPSYDLPRLLGHHSRDVFQRVFAFTVDELHDEALLSDESVNSQIYSAGMGGAKLPDALKRLSDEKGGLFRKGGSKHAIHRVAQSLERVDSALREVDENALEYGRLSARLEEVESELKRQNKRRREHQAQLDYQQQLGRAWGDWNDLVASEQGMIKLPIVKDFPSHGVNRLEALEERVRNARRERDSAHRDVEEAKARANTQIEHEAILESSTEISNLQRRRDYFDSAVRDLPKVETELSGFKNELTGALGELGSDWDEYRLVSFDLSIATRQDVSQHQETLRETRRHLQKSNSALDHAHTVLQEAMDAERDAQQKLDEATEPSLNDEQVRQRRTLIRIARSRLDQVRSIRERATDLKHQLDSLAISPAPTRQTNRNKTVAAIGVALIGVALFVGGAVVGGPTLAIAIIASLLVIGFAAYLFMTNSAATGTEAESPLTVPIRESLGRAESEQTELEKKLDKFAESLSVDVIDDDSLIAADDSLDRERSQLDLWNRLSESLAQARTVTARGTNNVSDCTEAVEEARNELEAAERQWREWLADRTLRETFSPDAVFELRSKVELGHTQLRNVERTQQRIDDIRNGIDTFTAAVGDLASDFDIEFDDENPQSASAAADALVELYDNVRQRAADLEEANTRLKDSERLREDREHDFRMAHDEMKQLLQSGNADDAEDFRNRAEIHSQRLDLERKHHEAIGRLQKISGPGERLESLKRKLSDIDIQAIDAETRRLQEELDETTTVIESLNKELGATQTGIQTLIGEEESSKLRMERHRLLEEMRGHAREWTVRTIAENLLKEARRKFEQERQPDVVRHSTGFFRGITDGRYETVFSPLGKSEIHVTNSEGGSKRPDQLSRGTREQLFLSLRFGLIRELGQRSETLPVIVDEALVNFDPTRGTRAASAFMDLAQTNQVLVFTCHPQIVDWFVSTAGEWGVQEPSVIEIE